MSHVKKIQSTRSDITLLILFYLLFIITAVYLICRSVGLYGGADNIVHYYIARYAFQEPIFFFDHWGKPLYTALSAPFAQMGLWGLHIFNIGIVILTSWFVYKTCIRLKVQNAKLIIPFVVFTPLYFLISQTVLTEILFSFLLVVSVYLFVTERYLFSAFLLSFLPFVRSEAIVIIPVFLLGYVFIKSYLSILLLFSGTIVYSLLGGIFYGDFLWLINKFPYTGASNIYHHGEILHFVRQYHRIWGSPLTIFMVLGFFVLVFRLIKRSPFINPVLIKYFVILGSAVIYLLAHSIAWWLGKGGSLGLIRVLAGVTPLFVILSLIGLNFLLDYIKIKYLRLFIKASFIFIIVIYPFKKYGFPYVDETNKLLIEATDWFKNSDYYGNKINFYNPFIPKYLNYDPFDENTSGWMIHFGRIPLDRMKENEILIWDSHFGPNEGQTPLSELKSNPRFEQIEVFCPKSNFKVLGGYDYCVYFFRVGDQYQIDQDQNNSKISMICDVNCLSEINNNSDKSLLDENYRVDGDREYINAFEISTGQYGNLPCKEVTASIQFSNVSEDLLQENDSTYLVMDITKKDDRIYLKKKLFSGSHKFKDEHLVLNHIFEQKDIKDAKVLVYVWNKGRNEFKIKKLKLEIIYVD